MSPRLVLNTRYVAEARVSVDLMAEIRGLINPFNLILLSIVMLVAERLLVVSVLCVPDSNSVDFHWVCPHAQIGFLTMCYFSCISFSFALTLPLNCILVIIGTSDLSEKQRVQVFGRAVFLYRFYCNAKG